eukprot:2582967-Pleurochrysis_carterae.AAC.1
MAMKAMRGTQRRGSGALVFSWTSMPVAANCSASSCASASACPSRNRMAARKVRYADVFRAAGNASR